LLQTETHFTTQYYNMSSKETIWTAELILENNI
jgi:hypothetical protein